MMVHHWIMLILWSRSKFKYLRNSKLGAVVMYSEQKSSRSCVEAQNVFDSKFTSTFKSSSSTKIGELYNISSFSKSASTSSL
ncbi:hypothetical protein OGAPHI_005928 [Ogataea philodendri]|uniref:Uncharacterized protein n=1 Tax=Ogataea philodendri TaxID=1378263 RepID=A0A9P8NYB6_9ASCO|nr:uncharacterized protein OGAPHI_005928 [Ogataea philodendri]KAH3661750.1 hypothetical protein OGAPHI_005928 [Ogataea philodendri]